MRETLIKKRRIEIIIRLGARAFQTPMFDFNVALTVVSNQTSDKNHRFFGIDVSVKLSPTEKAISLTTESPELVSQSRQLLNPESKIMLDAAEAVDLLLCNASSFQGIKTGDDERVRRDFWELSCITKRWKYFQSTVDISKLYGGLESLIDWFDNGEGLARRQGIKAWGKKGIMVSQMGRLPVALYLGEAFDSNASPIVPKFPSDLPALWEFCNSSDYSHEVRKVDQSLKPTNTSLVQVPFDLGHWQAVSAKKYPNGLPKPHSDDPTQWLFNGHPEGSTQPLHVAVARLLGYCWPRQTGSNFPDCPALGPDGLESFADEDGIVCLPPLSREQPAAGRLRRFLTAALGAFDERALIAAAGLKGSKSITLEDWLRDEFFEQHAKLFHDRPFIWHIWDGRPDGFHALVNYHRLDHAALQKLTYSYLGNWIQQQSDDARADKPGAAERLGAARALQIKLAAILEGEAPLDIFVRWKPLKEQAQGWHPDINDGIRQNIRPFLLAGDVGKRGAGLFRSVPLKLKDKDRGTEPHRPKADYPWFWCEESPGTDPPGGKDFVGSRWNDVHLTLARKKEVIS
jgi:hypothetical protein